MGAEIKDLAKIKECVKFLNEKFPQVDIIAYFPDKDEFNAWHICVTNYLYYTDKKFQSYTKFLGLKYKITFIAVYLHPVTIRMMKRRIIVR